MPAGAAPQAPPQPPAPPARRRQTAPPEVRAPRALLPSLVQRRCRALDHQAPTSIRRAGPCAHGPGARASGDVVELSLDHETETKEAVVELRAEQVAHRTRLSPLKFAAPAYAELNTAIAVPTATTLKLLTPEQLARKRSSEFLLLHGNDGLWATGAAALHAINHWASDHTKCGGSWGVI